MLVTRFSSFAAFAEAFPKIMSTAFEHQRPYREAFFARNGITAEQFNMMESSQRELYQILWVNSREFADMEQMYFSTKQ